MKKYGVLPPLALAVAVSAIAVPGTLNDLRHKVGHSFDDAYSRLGISLEKSLKHLEVDISESLHISNTQDDIAGHFPDGGFVEQRIGFESHDYSDYTILEIISKCGHTKEFSKLVSKHDKVAKLLNNQDTNLTLFVPVDDAFKDLPEHDKPSYETVDNILNYHIGLGNYPAMRILTTHTLPTAFNEHWLGGEPQRLRTSFGFSGVRVNLYSKVIVANIKAKNGWIHAVNRILVPPAAIGKELSLFPSKFSTLLLAYDKTDFVKYVHSIKMNGSTVFAPSNDAWNRLGPRANAFLFNTATGRKYLTALLKYQIVPNTTVYSDEIYYGDQGDHTQPPKALENFHIELPTLLEKSLGVDIHSWKGWSAIVVNGAVGVEFADAIGKNGVIHVVKDIPMPPCKKRGDDNILNGEIEVEDLKERLQDYVDENEDEQDGYYDL